MLTCAVGVKLSSPGRVLFKQERIGRDKKAFSLCSLYSFYRFVSVLGCKETATKERLFHYIVKASRATLHSQNRLNGFQDDLFQHESSTLAHMAILLYGG